MELSKPYPGLCKEETPTGATRWRVRVEGEKTRRITLAVTPDHAAFDAHYDAAREGRKLEAAPEKRVIKGTLDALRDDYLAWMEIQVQGGKLSTGTLSSRRTGLNQACDCLTPKGKRMGSVTADLPEEAFIRIVDSFETRTAAAQTCLKALRAAYTWGAKRGYPKNSPVFGVSANHEEGGGAVSWTPADIAMFLKRHGPGTMARLWFCLSHALANRIGDSRILGPGNERVINGVRFLEWQPQKKGSKFVSIPMHDILANELAFHEPDETYLRTTHGEPFASTAALGNRVRQWIIQAGLCIEAENAEGETVKKATRSQHGIRKGVAEMMAEAGASVYEIGAVLAHAETKTTQRYTEKTDRRKLAAEAAKKRANTEGVPRAQKRGTQ
ncbi:tyrosine-type recombinase/integrase [Aliiruegeria sabulilitoris]|uniref:tyrosine-type recombinase/integrase n=1 Tax=Aliiruegeria sabulilitoris TaxID=1510458 RepID=UPI00082B037D|nr:tyrosine-type recombinase/integrase [Aliiruegeria sabulilitoris]NDR57297.1 tyrosine-type recombinase/integrase [Pseudoruegeria sp. M32A2M]